MKLATILALLTFNLYSLFSQSNFLHPRGLLLKEEVPEIRLRVKSEPFKSMALALKMTTEEMNLKSNKNISDSSELARLYAYMYILTGNNVEGEKAWLYTSAVINNKDIFCNPVSRGLNRARLLRNIAEAYDLCYEVWDNDKRILVSEKLIYVIMTTSSNMGYDANYSIESNWMGVRYGAVYFASLVCDDFSATSDIRSRLLPYQWDANKRLGEHMKANLNSNGWNTESLSYFSYNWSFIGPALVAFKNHYQNRFDSYIVTEAHNALWGYSTASVSIRGINGKVTQPDFSDDDPMGDYFPLALGLRLFPESQKPALLWMINYLSSIDTWSAEKVQPFYNIIWHPVNISAENPEKAGWLTYYDPEQGIAFFRNRFLDKNDILSALTATANRVRGHQGEDNLGFRIIGLGSIWAVGAGRTGYVAGQSTLFPAEKISDTLTGFSTKGKVLNIKLEKDGSGSMTVTGSCVGVKNHTRTMVTDYSKRSGAEAVIIISDISDNGRKWRMNSPEFNNLKILDDGFLLTSPEGSELKAVVFTDAEALRVTSEKIHYGGNTVQNNSGIAYNDRAYNWTNAIDCNTKGKISVVFTLQPKGAEHPPVSLVNDQQIKVGNIIYTYYNTNSPSLTK